MDHLLIKDRQTLRHKRFPGEAEKQELCGAFGAALHMIYPGYLWQVGMNQDMVHILCATLSTTHGITMHLSDIDVDGKALMRAGGEILERFNCNRRFARSSEVHSVKRNPRGDGLPTN